MEHESQTRMGKRGRHAMCVCVVLGGGNSVRAATFRTESDRNNKKKIKNFYL
jgi:hypothetical protein